MGRSVSYARGSVAIAYQTPSFEYVDEETGEVIQDYYFWDDYKESLRYQIKNLFPSMNECDEWLDREDLAIMENNHAYIGVSEYCGLVSIWLVPKEHYDAYTNHTALDNCAIAWCNQVKSKFLDQFGEYEKVAVFSNGEAMYSKREQAA